MALLENLVAGNIYLVKIAASNEVGEGPFSNAVEFAVLPKETSESNQRPKRLDSGDSTSQWQCFDYSVTSIGKKRSLFVLAVTTFWVNHSILCEAVLTV